MGNVAKAGAASQKGKALPEGVVPFEKYEIATMDRKELQSLMSETLGALDVSEFDLERISVPTGGTTSWEIVTAEGETESVKSFDAIIVGFKHTRSYYVESFDESGGGSPPDCSSNDAIVGVGKPGGNCKTCPLAQFGTSPKENSDGQACTQNMVLFIIRPEEIMPSIVKVPPTSIKDMKRAIMKIAFQKRVHHYHGLVRFCLVADKNKAGLKYSAIKLKFLGAITSKLGKELATTLHNGVKPLIEGSGIGGAQLMAPPQQQQLAGPTLLDGEDVSAPEAEPAPEPEVDDDGPTEAELAEAEEPEAPEEAEATEEVEVDDFM